MITPPAEISSFPTGAIEDDRETMARTPPHNFEAEKALLGAILSNNNAYDSVSDYLRGVHFSDPIHGKIYESVSKLIERGQIADPITLKNFFEQDGSLADIGGNQYLVELAASMVNVINAGEYGKHIHDLFVKRELIDLGHKVVNSAYSSDVDYSANQQIEEAEQNLYELSETGEFDGGFQPFKSSVISAIEMAEAAHKNEEGIVGVPTGLKDLDDRLGGLHKSDLVIIAGRPSMGKTALATNIAFNAARKLQESGKKSSIAFSLSTPFPILPLMNFSFILFSISASFFPTAYRKRSASPNVKPAMSCAICINCSW